jgi:hypothetical protein
MKDVAGIMVADVTGEMGMGKYIGGRTSPTRDEIAQLAFSLYEERGRQRTPRRRLAAGGTGARAALRVTAWYRPKHTTR